MRVLGACLAVGLALVVGLIALLMAFEVSPLAYAIVGPLLMVGLLFGVVELPKVIIGRNVPRLGRRFGLEHAVGGSGPESHWTLSGSWKGRSLEARYAKHEVATIETASMGEIKVFGELTLVEMACASTGQVWIVANDGPDVAPAGSALPVSCTTGDRAFDAHVADAYLLFGEEDELAAVLSHAPARLLLGLKRRLRLRDALLADPSLAVGEGKIRLVVSGVFIEMGSLVLVFDAMAELAALLDDEAQEPPLADRSPD